MRFESQKRNSLFRIKIKNDNDDDDDNDNDDDDDDNFVFNFDNENIARLEQKVFNDIVDALKIENRLIFYKFNFKQSSFFHNFVAYDIRLKFDEIMNFDEKLEKLVSKTCTNI